MLLKTVPTTAAGCVALARFAVEFLQDEGFVLDEAQGVEHARILDLIARSPMLAGEPKGRPFAPDLSAMSVDGLRRTYDAFKLSSDIMGLSGWALRDESEGSPLMDAELDRLSFFQGDIADELKRRAAAGDKEAVARMDTLISRAVACGAYDEAAQFASDGHAQRL